MKTTNKRRLYDPKTQKNYLAKQSTEDVPSTEELVKKVKYHIERAASLIPKPTGSEFIGFICAFAYERSTNDKFDYQSASLVDLEKVNIVASDMLLKDLTTKIKKSYGKEEDAVRQDGSVINN